MIERDIENDLKNEHKKNPLTFTEYLPCAREVLSKVL